MILEQNQYFTTSERLGLREVKIDDGYVVIPWWLDQEVVYHYNIPPDSLNPEKLWKYFIRDLNDSTQFCVVAELLTGGEIVAYLSLNHIDERKGSADFCIIVSKRWRGKGIGYEASCILLNYFFKEFDIPRVVLGVWVNNAAGFALFRKLGFKMVGRTQSKGYYHDPFVEYEMALEKRDWIKRCGHGNFR